MIPESDYSRLKPCLTVSVLKCGAPQMEYFVLFSAVGRCSAARRDYKDTVAVAYNERQLIDVTIVRGVRPRSEIECKYHTRDALCLHSSCALSAGRAPKLPPRRVPPPPFNPTFFARTCRVFYFHFSACGAVCAQSLKATCLS